MKPSIKVMLLEDDTNKSEIISFFLKNTKSVKLEKCRTLPEALDKLSSSNYDIFLLDLDSDLSPGIETYRIIHASTPEIPVMILTDDEDSQIVTIALREGAEDSLNFDQLDSTLLVKSIYHAIENKKRKEHSWRLLFTIDQIPTSIIMVDSQGNIDYVNTRFTELTGYKNHEICGENIKTSNLDIMKNKLLQAISECLEIKKALEGETLITTKKGEIRWAHYSISPIKNIENSITHFVASIEDVTELKKKEEEIRLSEEKFRALVHNINEYVYSVTYSNRKPVSTFHSPKCVDITGYTPEEFINSRNLWYSMIYEADKIYVESFINTIMKNLGESSIEHRIVHKNGSIRWVSNTCTSLKAEDGTVSGLYGFILDITERKEWELQIKKLSKAVTQSPVSVIITDRDGRIEYVNPKFTEATGYSSDEITGKSPDYIASSRQDLSFYRDIFDKMSGGKDWHGELRTQKKNGEYLWESSSVSTITNRKNEITHFVAINEDITERKIAEEALRASEEILRKRNETMEKDLKLAQLIQKAFLPKKIPEINGIGIDFRHIPMEKIGGDYFSIVPLDDDTLSVFVGDVSGHGVSAALFLSLVKSATDRMLNKFGEAPDLYMSGLNSLLIAEMPSFFITAIYGVFQYNKKTSSMQYRFSNGGHPYPIQYESRSKEIKQHRLGGTIVGMFEEAKYHLSSIDLEKGDRIFLFTDGITEIGNSDNQMIGFDEDLIELFRRSNSAGLSDTLDGVISELDLFRGDVPINDDIVLIGIEV